MSAVMQESTTPAPAAPKRVELELPGSKEMPRLIILRETTTGSGLSVTVYRQRRRGKTTSFGLGRSLAYACNDWKDCRLIRGDCLWMGRAAFDVTVAESVQIEQAFASRGLEIEEPKP